MISGIDIGILLAIIFSMFVGASRGFFREALSLLTWLFAFVITVLYTSRFSVLLPTDSIESPQARLVISGLFLFFSSMIIGGLLNYIFQKLIASSGKTKIDLWLGVVFGAVRGVVVVVLLVLLANLFPTLRQEGWWKGSELLPGLQKAAQSIHTRLPREIAQHFDFTESVL